MNKSDLLEHNIFKPYLNDLSAIAKILLEAKENNTKPEFSERQILIKNLYYHLAEIENKQRDIQIAKSFLKSPKTIGRKNKKIQTRSDYIKYHIEFYQICIVGIFDRILHLINFLYELGLSDRHATKDVICSNSNIPLNIVSLIKKFDKKLDPIRKTQNSVKHKEKIYLPELYNADLLDFTLHQWKEVKAKKINVGYTWSKQDEIFLKKDADFYYQVFLEKERMKIDTISSDLDSFIRQFLDILDLQFKVRLSKCS